MLKLNIGCGHEKLEGFINIDADAALEPDQVLDITQKLPFADGCADEIRCFHTIEHLKAESHNALIAEFNRVLALGGKLYMAYPEAIKCFEGWKDNTKGQREFYEKTILGRGLTYWDLHKTLMDSLRFVPLLREFGFKVSVHEEPQQTFNTVLICVKVFKVQDRDQIFKKELHECLTA